MAAIMMSVCLCMEAPAAAVTETETQESQVPTETQTSAETQAPAVTEGETVPSENTTETSAPATETEDTTETPASDTEIEDTTETPSTPGDTVPPTDGEANSEAMDMIVIEDENGILEQETETSEPVETETEEITETETETESETKKDELKIEEESETSSSWGESLIDFQAYPIGNISENEAEVYRYLREEMGLNKAAACGVLANVLCESGFSPVAVGDGGSSYGICQWHAGRFSSLVGWCNARGYNYHSVEGQLRYLQYELETGYSGVLNYLQNVPDTARGAYEAGYYWCMHFEIPNDTVNRSIQRGKIAMGSYYPADLDAKEKKNAKSREQEIMDNIMVIEDTDMRIQYMTQFYLHANLADLSLDGVLEIE